MESNYSKLKKIYKSNYKQLLFLNEKRLAKNNSIHMYIYDYENELKNFSKTFNEYFPFYVDNFDSMKYYNLEENIEEELIKQSKKLWKSPYVDNRDIDKWGIFGEVLVDFLVRIVYENETMLTYASKKSYNDKTEFKGIDNLSCCLNEDKLEIIMSEVKFVSSLSSAKSDLISDIQGECDSSGELKKEGHLNSKFLNSYVEGFALKQQESVEKLLLRKAAQKISKLNEKIIAEDKTFIEAMNLLDYKIRFIYFAIFKSVHKEPSEILTQYEEIINSFNNQISMIGINNYDLDVIFIPTDNKSKEIKEKMVEIYG